MVSSLAVDRRNETLVLCDLFELLLASIDSSLPLGGGTWNTVLTRSVTMTRSTPQRTYTCHGYALYDLLCGSVRQGIKSGVGGRCGWRRRWWRESLIFLLQQPPGLSYLQYCGLHAFFTDFTDMSTVEALATSAIATSTPRDTGLLIAATMQLSSLPFSSPVFLFSSLFSGDDTSATTSLERPARLPVRKRPRVSDLRQYQSVPTAASAPASAPTSSSKQDTHSQCSPMRGRARRRCVSANRARRWFSFDRFVSSRSPSSPDSPFVCLMPHVSGMITTAGLFLYYLPLLLSLIAMCTSG